MKKYVKLLFSRVALGAIFLLLQIFAVVAMLTYFRSQYAIFQYIFIFLAVVVVIYILNRDGDSAYKTAWIIPILAFPIWGIPLYFLFGKAQLSQKSRDAFHAIKVATDAELSPLACSTSELIDEDAQLQSQYITFSAAQPAFTGTETEYFPIGDLMFPRMMEELKKAEKYIFLEFFIIEQGLMWDSILAVLEEKVAAGVDVRVIYDDMGCLTKLPSDYDRQLRNKGIKCRVFHRFQPRLSGSFNNRDHRKILSIDGVVAFTGGINLADEYINHVEHYGHWLDCGVMLRGKAAWSFTVSFIQMWRTLEFSKSMDYSAYRPAPGAFDGIASDGFVQPYVDTPSDDETVGRNVYLNMIYRAKRYVYICTPYLVLDNELTTALTSAAKSGVDVRIVTPGIPDKWYVYHVTQSYYNLLIRQGVRIFQYTPGFIHSKTFVSDDEYGICGTINLDYRSFFLHHECAVWMYKSKAVTQMVESYAEILDLCTEITAEMCQNRSVPRRIVQSILRVFAPLM